jgi:hypothetical protein
MQSKIGKTKTANRKTIVEHLFGTIKYLMGKISLTASIIISPKDAASLKLPILPLEPALDFHSESFEGLLVPIFTWYSCLRHPFANDFATSPEPRIPIFIIVLLLSVSNQTIKCGMRVHCNKPIIYG